MIRDAVRFSNPGGQAPQAVHNVVGKICLPLVGIGLTELPNSGWAKSHPAHLLTASLHVIFLRSLIEIISNQIIALFIYIY